MLKTRLKEWVGHTISSMSEMWRWKLCYDSFGLALVLSLLRTFWIFYVVDCFHHYSVNGLQNISKISSCHILLQHHFCRIKMKRKKRFFYLFIFVMFKHVNWAAVHTAINHADGQRCTFASRVIVLTSGGGWLKQNLSFACCECENRELLPGCYY